MVVPNPKPLTCGDHASLMTSTLSTAEELCKETICCSSRAGTVPAETLNKVSQTGGRDQGKEEDWFTVCLGMCKRLKSWGGPHQVQGWTTKPSGQGLQEVFKACCLALGPEKLSPDVLTTFLLLWPSPWQDATLQRKGLLSSPSESTVRHGREVRCLKDAACSHLGGWERRAGCLHSFLSFHSCSVQCPSPWDDVQCGWVLF